MPTDTSTPAIRLKAGEFRRLAADAGLTTPVEISRRMRMAHTTVGRVLSGEYAPGPEFIARAMSVFGVQFEALFEADSRGVAA